MAKRGAQKEKRVNVALLSETDKRVYEILVVRAEGMVCKLTLSVPQGGTLRLREKPPGEA